MCGANMKSPVESNIYLLKLFLFKSFSNQLQNNRNIVYTLQGRKKVVWRCSKLSTQNYKSSHPLPSCYHPANPGICTVHQFVYPCQCFELSLPAEFTGKSEEQISHLKTEWVYSKLWHVPLLRICFAHKNVLLLVQVCMWYGTTDTT